jgi:glycosyltransferase involved in cell wall biosynthesis
VTSCVQGELASIIIPCFNQIEVTRLCVSALFRFTRSPWELIAIDNGSTDGTGFYLEGMRDAAPVPVTLINNARNRGFPAAINQGLQLARGEYLVLLNNDAVVTDGWLDQLIALTALPAQRIGLVGPMSNYAAPPQLIERVPYEGMEDMHAFAQRWRDEHRGTWFIVPKLSGFCMLMTRAVYDSVGGLDERFGLGLFDDDDLAERARRAGFTLAVAHDLFVHHFGSRTFVGNGIDAKSLLDENARRFAAKWGRDTPLGRRVTLQPWSNASDFPADSGRAFGHQVDAWAIEPSTAAPLGGLAILPLGGGGQAGGDGGNSRSGRRPHSPTTPQSKPPRREGKLRVSLTMIVRDEEQNLPACLESVRGIFDEIVVVDTGSTDRTVEIAQNFGARVWRFTWVDDFAAARNEALSRATGDYAFWLDADDVVDPPERVKLQKLLGSLRPDEPSGFVVSCACDPGADGSGGHTVVDHVRLFPRRDDLRWSYRVHEQIMPALNRGGIPVRWTDLIVRHTGYVDVAMRARKLDRDWRILQEELISRPDEPFILFNLGAIAIERRDWPGALEYLRKSLARSAPADSITRKLFALISRSHQMLGETAAALRTCAEGLSFDDKDAELLFRKAVVHRQRGESAEAEASWQRILGLVRPQQFASLDMGIYGHLTRRNLAVLAEERCDAIAAAEHWRAVLEECPGDREARANLERLPHVVDARAATPVDQTLKVAKQLP